jgi:hypothetical protein
MSALGCVHILLLVTAAPPISVRGDTACPTASEVSAALVGLVVARDRQQDRSPDRSETQSVAPDVVVLSGRGGSVSVKLTKTSEVIAEKLLPATLSCAERARAAAVMVAAWEARLRAGKPPLLPLSLPSQAASNPIVPIVPIAPMTPIAPIAPIVLTAPTTPTAPPSRAPVLAPTVAPILAPATIASPAPPAVLAQPTARNSPQDAVTLTAAAETRSAGPVEVETGAALLASVTAGSVSPAVLLEAKLGRRDSRFAVGIEGLAVGTHTTTVRSPTTTVGPGEGTWRRFGGVFDVRSISRWRTMELEMQAGLALTALAITGQSLPVIASATIFDPGVLAGLRSRFRFGRLSPWVQATAAFWPRTHNIYVTGTANSAELPPFEALLGAGVSLGANR